MARIGEVAISSPAAAPVTNESKSLVSAKTKLDKYNKEASNRPFFMQLKDKNSLYSLLLIYLEQNIINFEGISSFISYDYLQIMFSFRKRFAFFTGSIIQFRT